MCYKKKLSQLCKNLSRGGIESVFRNFTKFNIRKKHFSRNSIWEKRTLHKIHCEENTLHKIQYKKNGLFTKFNSAHVYIFRRAPHLPPVFLEVKNVPCSFLGLKSKPCPFSTISSHSKVLLNIYWRILPLSFFL